MSGIKNAVSITVMLKDTHTLCFTGGIPAALMAVNKAGTKINLGGLDLTIKADKKGEYSAHMVYVVETKALAGLATGASKASPMEFILEIPGTEPVATQE